MDKYTLIPIAPISFVGPSLLGAAAGRRRSRERASLLSPRREFSKNPGNSHNVMIVLPMLVLTINKYHVQYFVGIAIRFHQAILKLSHDDTMPHTIFSSFHQFNFTLNVKTEDKSQNET